MTNTLGQLSDDMANMIERAAPSVLRVDARRRLPATGIAWSEELIVTAHHVVESEDHISIGLPDGSRIDASLLGRDPHNDLALLRAEGGLIPADWAADDALRVGNLVLALGRPGQKVKATGGIASGLVSPVDIKRRREKFRTMKMEHSRGRKRRRRMRMEGLGDFFERGGWLRGLADGFIQTDVTMYPGFSGGPLLGADGAVHGLNTSGFSLGVSVAIPVATIRRSVGALLADGKIQRGYLGIGVQEARLPDKVAETLDQDTGLLIVSVDADSPAARAELMVGDILTALDQTAIEHVDELQLLLTKLAAGSAVSVAYVRGGETCDGSVIVGEK
ncbi:MAG: trypsin-like peptidase domain-containing protein [Chloroflexota bacterium]|nr:trypsin-like peptidase domain-containing protein [Chloroflexota bacterium]